MEEHKCEHNDISYPKGLKWTKQRKCVYQVLEEATEPLSAVQIYNRIERDHEGSDYAVSTIYRILATFEEHGMVEKTTFMGDGTVVYELNRGEHTHYAVCLECHKRIPLPSCPFAHVHLEPGYRRFHCHRTQIRALWLLQKVSGSPRKSRSP